MRHRGSHIAFVLAWFALSISAGGDSTILSGSEGGSANEDVDIRDLENRALEAAEGSTRPSLSCTHTKCMLLMIMPITFKSDTLAIPGHTRKRVVCHSHTELDSVLRCGDR